MSGMITGGINVAMQVWDIGGQSIAGGMLDKYIYGADVSLYCVSMSSFQLCMSYIFED